MLLQWNDEHLLLVCSSTRALRVEPMLATGQSSVASLPSKPLGHVSVKTRQCMCTKRMRVLPDPDGMVHAGPGAYGNTVASASAACGAGMWMYHPTGRQLCAILRMRPSSHSILTLALLHLLTFLKSDTFAPSRWYRQDSGHMTAALPICRLDPRQFEHRTRRLQSGGLRGAFLPGFRKTPWRSAKLPAYWPGVLCS